MSKIGKIFSMSKQERMGAWAIAILIVILLGLVVIERKCTSDVNVDQNAQKQATEYVEKASKTKVKEPAKKKTTKQKSKTTKSTAKRTSKASETKQKTKSKPKSKATTTKKKQPAKKQSSGKASRLVEPVPQF